MPRRWSTHLAGIADKESHRRRAGGAGADRARRRRLGARRAVAARPGDRARRRRGARARTCGSMLGLADRTRVIDLFEALMRGDVAAALKELREQYDIGADPAVVLADLAEFTHFVTRVKIVPAVADDISLGEAERTRGRAFAATLSMRVLSRTWQMLLKGIAEVQAARPAARRRRDGAGAHRLCGRSADARRGDPLARRRRRRGGSRPQGNGGGAQRRLGAHARPHPRARIRVAPRYDAPRGGAPRAVAAPAAQPAADPAARSGAQLRPALAINSFEELVALAERQARHPDQARAGARRAAGALRGRHARNRARAERGQDAGQRSVAQAAAMDRPVAGWSWSRASRARRR